MCQKAELRGKVDCATLPFTEISSAEGDGNPKTKFYKILRKMFLANSSKKVLENQKKKSFGKFLEKSFQQVPHPSNCLLTVPFLRNRSEELFSPTYPGTYPKALDCAYKFIGEPGQRIRLEFRDFDLFYGGAQ